MAVIGITGGGGFVGREVVAAHERLGDKVHILSRSPPSVTSTRRVFVTDLKSPETRVLEEFADGCDVVYHMAAVLTGDSRVIDRVNVDGTAAVLSAATGRVGRFVQLSSVGTYGLVERGMVDESYSPDPSDPYERSKLNADRQVTAVASRGKLDAVLIQPSMVVGPAMSSSILRNLAALARRGLPLPWCHPEAMLNVIALDDLVVALLAAGTGLGDGRYIVSSPVLWSSIFDAFEEDARRPRRRLSRSLTFLATRVGSLVPRVPINPTTYGRLTSTAIFSSTRAERDLNWAPVPAPLDSVRTSSNV